ncbi:MAG: HAD hydrolase-like protein, partial [Saprospiraceae bacterium]|nr:HAD hydrolase-like protein [Saprospiraceae bacterium]
MQSGIKAFIFDMDGVIVDTAGYHYQSWVRLAQSFNYRFKKADNEALKGVSRMQSLEIILALADEHRSTKEKEAMCATKNDWYLD